MKEVRQVVLFTANPEVQGVNVPEVRPLVELAVGLSLLIVGLPALSEVSLGVQCTVSQPVLPEAYLAARYAANLEALHRAGVDRLHRGRGVRPGVLCKMHQKVRSRIGRVVPCEVDLPLQPEVDLEVQAGAGVVLVVLYGADLQVPPGVVLRVDHQVEEVQCTVGREVVLVALYVVDQAALCVAGRVAVVALFVAGQVAVAALCVVGPVAVAALCVVDQAAVLAANQQAHSRAIGVQHQLQVMSLYKRRQSQKDENRTSLLLDQMLNSLVRHPRLLLISYQQGTF